MLSFLDGPAAGQHLACGRAPKFLRVVRGPDGRFDALDRLDDAPEPGEVLYVYRLEGEAGVCHVAYRDRDGRRRGAWYASAEYRFVAAQPAQEILRDRDAWRAWAAEQHLKEKARG